MVQPEGLSIVICHEFGFFVYFLLTDFSIFNTNKRLQMKKLATSILFLFVCTLAVKAVGPDKATIATMNEKMVITLPTNVPLSDTYLIDISAIPFSSEALLSGFCQSFSENHMTLTGNFSTKQITLSLHSTEEVAGEKWDLIKWNEYLSSRAPKMLMYVNTQNK